MPALCTHHTRLPHARRNKRRYRPPPKHSALPRYYARYGAAPCHCIKTEKRARRIALASIKTERELSSATLPRTVWCGLPRTGRSQEASPVGWAHGRQPEASCGRVGSYSERAANSGHRGSAQMACRYPGRSTPIVQLGYEYEQRRCGVAGGAAAHQPEEHLEQGLSSSGSLEEAGQQLDRHNRRDPLRGQVARYHIGHLPTREAAPSTQCEAGVRDWAEASSGSRQP